VKKFKIYLVSLMLASFGLLQPASTSAQAINNTVNMSVPINLTVNIPCANGGAGEFVALSGDLHVLFHVTINGNIIQLSSQAQPQGVSGLDQSSGDKYQGTGVTRFDFTASLDGSSAFQDTFVNNFRIIGQGPGNNLLVHQTFHVTVTPNGDLTAFVDNFSVDCK